MSLGENATSGAPEITPPPSLLQLDSTKRQDLIAESLLRQWMHWALMQL